MLCIILGYLLSKEAVHRFVTQGIIGKNCSDIGDGTFEDAGTCTNTNFRKIKTSLFFKLTVKWRISRKGPECKKVILRKTALMIE